ncbi:rhomboid family intramembrane serine protease [Ferrimonas gelatinilytica]|uniref:Peptidase S54 rhomboid domain-containing protein n=1 Tax=Ferrimonas gelatinilytica TaxID=1255257 RepID=A0ABP9RXI8_9GAMM
MRVAHHLTQFKQSLLIATAFTLVLWGIWLWEQLFGLYLGHYGVLPRHTAGLLGILTAPLIHGDAAHLAANSTGLLILGTALLYGYPRCRFKVIALIWLVSGAGVWLVGRMSFHFGASGLTHGIFFFLLVASLLRRDPRSLALMMAAFFMFGGMIYGILPRYEGISFETHLFGAVGGVLGALWFWRDDPLPRRKHYDWEYDPPADPVEEDCIGELWRQADGPERPLEKQERGDRESQ